MFSNIVCFSGLGLFLCTYEKHGDIAFMDTEMTFVLCILDTQSLKVMVRSVFGMSV